MNIDKILSTINIAEELDDKDLNDIGYHVKHGFDRDLESREQWDMRNAEALKLALQVRQSKSFPWPEAANVHYPLVTVACMQFNARAYPALIPNTKIVKHRVIGEDPTGEKQARADRVSNHMNYQLTDDDSSFEDGVDRMLMTEPLLGCSFQKTYFDGEKNISEHVTPENFVVDYYTQSLDTCRRKTHILYKHKNEILEKMRLGEWIEYDLDKRPSPDRTYTRESADEAKGMEPPSDDYDAPYTVLEQHCYLDLDEDGYDEPYIVTILEETRQVLRITKGFQPENIYFNQRGQVAKIVQDQYFTKFGFIPSPDGGFYDIGFGILLSPMNESVNTIINQLIDAGTLSNLQSGYISSNIRIADGRAIFQPGEWKKVKHTGDDLRKGIVPLPVREPSQTLMALLGVLIEAGQKIGSVSEMMVGENPGQNQPAQTTMAVLEQGLKVYSAIIKRNHRSLTAVFRKFYKLNSLYMNPEEYYEVLDPTSGDAGVVYQTDYEGDPKDIAPVSDPNIVSDAQRLAKAEAVRAAAYNNPTIYNVYSAERQYLEALQVEGIDMLLIPEDQIQPPQDPEAVLEAQKFEHQVQMDNFKLELDAQETIVNMKKKMVDTQRSMATIEKGKNDYDLDVAKFIDEAELKRAELIAKTMIERNKLEKMNANTEGSK